MTHRALTDAQLFALLDAGWTYASTLARAEQLRQAPRTAHVRRQIEELEALAPVIAGARQWRRAKAARARSGRRTVRKDTDQEEMF